MDTGYADGTDGNAVELGREEGKGGKIAGR
jgi:hypothetical protein